MSGIRRRDFKRKSLLITSRASANRVFRQKINANSYFINEEEGGSGVRRAEVERSESGLEIDSYLRFRGDLAQKSHRPCKGMLIVEIAKLFARIAESKIVSQ